MTLKRYKEAEQLEAKEREKLLKANNKPKNWWIRPVGKIN